MNPAGGAVLSAAIDAARLLLGERLTAAFAIGSLAHGGFVPSVSDVDLALIVRGVDASDQATIDAVAERTQQSTPGELAERLSIFWGSWDSLAGGADHGRFPAIDRLDLLRSGVLLAGLDERARVPEPTHAEVVIETAQFALAKLHDPSSIARLSDPAGLLRDGRRAVTKAVLSPVRFLFTGETGGIGSNDDAAAWYSSTRAVAPELVRAGVGWRTAGIEDTADALRLLGSDLLPLHVEFLGAYAQLTRDAGQPDLADALATVQHSLTSAAGAPSILP